MPMLSSVFLYWQVGMDGMTFDWISVSLIRYEAVPSLMTCSQA